MVTVAQAFGRRLSTLRKLQGITQARLAKILGVTPEYVSNLERGSSTPSFELIGRIARSLNTEIANLFLFGTEAGESPGATDNNTNAEAASSHVTPDWTRYITGVGSWSYDVGADDLWWSPSMYRLLGFYFNEDMPSIELYDSAIHPGDRERILRQREELFEAGETVAAELRLIRADGQVRHVVSYAEVLRNRENTVTHAFGELIDITEQKRLEASLRNLHEALEDRVTRRTETLNHTVSDLHGALQEREAALSRLKASEARFRSLVESMREVFWINDRTTNKLIYMSPSFEDVYGAPPEVLRNDIRRFLTLVHPDDRDAAEDAFRRARGGSGEFSARYRVVGRDGVTRWIHSRGRPFHDNPRLFAGMAEDVTDIETALLQLREARPGGIDS